MNETQLTSAIEQDRVLGGTDGAGKKKLPAPPSHPPAITVFRDKTHRFPNKAWFADIAAIVGEKQEDLERWGEIVHLWVGRGFSPVNVVGMLDVFQNGWRESQGDSGMDIIKRWVNDTP